jgi:hypothetical protein
MWSPALNGKVFNYSEHDLNKFEIKISYGCDYVPFSPIGFAEGHSCGDKDSVGILGRKLPDGGQEISFPSKIMISRVPFLSRSSIVAIPEVKLNADSEIMGSSPGNDYTTISNGYGRLNYMMQEIRLFHFPARQLNFVLSDGRNALPYIKSILPARKYHLLVQVNVKINDDKIFSFQRRLKLATKRYYEDTDHGYLIDDFTYPDELSVIYGALPEQIKYLTMNLVIIRDASNLSEKIVYQISKNVPIEKFRGYPEEFIKIPVDKSWGR